eukprot:m.138006 g.138006  ORF g.138006 m.138006 type:complete len:78 (-) comp17593_c0_seq2:206-439(-)
MHCRIWITVHGGVGLLQHVVSMTPSGPGGPATCTARKESVDFHRVSSDEHAIAKESKAAYDNIVDKCGKYPNNQCYL